MLLSEIREHRQLMRLSSIQTRHYSQEEEKETSSESGTGSNSFSAASVSDEDSSENEDDDSSRLLRRRVKMRARPKLDLADPKDGQFLFYFILSLSTRFCVFFCFFDKNSFSIFYRAICRL